MSCVICLEDGAEFACECSCFHVHCLSNFLLRNGNRGECSICFSRFDRSMLATALDIAFTRTSNLFGPAHGTTMVLKLELATALAIAGDAEKAKRLLQDIIAAAVEPSWLVSVAKVELARTLRNSGEPAAACRALEGLVPCLARAADRWAQHEHVEACTLLGACYLDLGHLAMAEKKLFLAMDDHLHNENCCAKKVVACMRHIANYYEARNELVLARDTYRVVLNIVEAEECDPSRVALARLDLASADIKIGDISQAAARLRGVIQALRKRKHDGYAMEALPESRKKLASVVRPSKRLRAKTLPEDC